MHPQAHGPDRRSGLDRRGDDAIVGDATTNPSHPEGRLTTARWPLDVEPGWSHPRPRDPWADVVQRSITAYRAGRIDELLATWDEAISWHVMGRRNGRILTDHATGPASVFAYHRQLLDQTDGTFRQRLISLEGSNGPIVEAHLRTTATRRGRSLAIPALIVFELSLGRIRDVQEIPGDQVAWDRFWAD